MCAPTKAVSFQRASLGCTPALGKPDFLSLLTKQHTSNPVFRASGTQTALGCCVVSGKCLTSLNTSLTVWLCGVMRPHMQRTQDVAWHLAENQ